MQVSKKRHAHETHADLGSNIVCLLAELLHLLVVISPLERHLLVLLLQSFDSLLRAKTFLFSMFLRPVELFLGVLVLLRHSLKVWSDTIQC